MIFEGNNLAQFFYFDENDSLRRVSIVIVFPSGEKVLVLLGNNNKFATKNYQVIYGYPPINCLDYLEFKIVFPDTIKKIVEEISKFNSSNVLSKVGRFKFSLQSFIDENIQINFEDISTIFYDEYANRQVIRSITDGFEIVGIPSELTLRCHGFEKLKIEASRSSIESIEKKLDSELIDNNLKEKYYFLKDK